MNDNFDVSKWMKTQLLKEDEANFEAEKALTATLETEFPGIEEYSPTVFINPYGTIIKFKARKNVDENLFNNIVTYLEKQGYTVKKADNVAYEEDDRGFTYPSIELTK